MPNFLDRPTRESIAVKEFKPLPVGGYVLKIIDAEKKSNTNGNMWIEVQFDISEGEHKDYFTEQYKNSTLDNVKYKGKFIIGIPNEQSEWYQSQFNNFWRNIYAIEDSNGDYRFEFDRLDTLRGKRVGGVFSEKEWEYNGKTGMAVQCAYFKSVDEIRKGDFKVPKPKMLKKKTVQPQNAAATGFVELGEDDDLPF